MRGKLAVVWMVLICGGAAMAQGSQADTLKMLMRQVDMLTRELEKEELGDVAGRTYESRYGLAEAASQVYQASGTGVTLAGYGELVYENYGADRDDGEPSGKRDQIDALRQILYVGYRFNDRFVFNSEIEFEHGKAGEGQPGAVSLEFSYIDMLITPAFNVRAGMVLAPVGIVNELHEPPTFFGALRPEVERNLIPSTWRVISAGIHGATEAGLSYRAYVVEGFNAAGFSASGIRSGRQNGAKAAAEDFGLTGRLEYLGIPGVQVGVSGYFGNSGQSVGEGGLDVATSLLSAHATVERNGVEARALVVRGTIGDAEELTMARELNDPIGETQLGYYGAIGYDVLGALRPGSTAQVLPFVQYERLNTQESVPDGYTANPANERTNLTLGVMVRPIRQIALKLDYINRDNEAGTATDQFNIGLGYYF